MFYLERVSKLKTNKFISVFRSAVCDIDEYFLRGRGLKSCDLWKCTNAQNVRNRHYGYQLQLRFVQSFGQCKGGEGWLSDVYQLKYIQYKTVGQFYLLRYRNEKGFNSFYKGNMLIYNFSECWEILLFLQLWKYTLHVLFNILLWRHV